ncbi:class I SAM-dependent DNA methyltransferase [Gluconacetobacter sp. Hr-1-5]|uniref:class I SAM-dependent DNA methyltransferase n=1 Tax=Gluconacetobacter sp. Hr-1-5 TaxID=3395370 RepID=UPI003B524886
MSERAARFDRLYAGDIDPWKFRSSAYEKGKYRATMEALPRPRYALAIEAGCSIGELTRLLSRRCDHVIGLDVSSVALDASARRNADRPNITFRCGELPGAWPAGSPVDLIVLSEVLYFLSPDEIEDLADRIAANWCPDGHCVLVNYLGPTAEALQGAEAADLFISAMTALPGIRSTVRMTKDRYRLDLLTRDISSPAYAAGSGR